MGLVLLVKALRNFYLAKCRLKWVPGAKVARWHLKGASVIKATCSGKDERPARRYGLRIISLTGIVRRPKMLPVLGRVLISALIADIMASRVRSKILIEDLVPARDEHINLERFSKMRILRSNGNSDLKMWNFLLEKMQLVVLI